MGEKMRELFVEDLTAVQGGATTSGPYTTMACCEEGPFGCCETSLDDILKP
ncbi:MAG: hypothetical protein M3279_09340 [Actinomycetota bacterium]|nr:hypothetical protein [Actinomycetota bacterium]